MRGNHEGCKFNGVGAGIDSQRNLDLSTRRPVYLSTCQPVDLYANVTSDVGIKGVSLILYLNPNNLVCRMPTSFTILTTLDGRNFSSFKLQTDEVSLYTERK